MNIHLIRTYETNPALVNDVIDYLSQYSGPVRFLAYEDPVAFQERELSHEIWSSQKILEQRIELEAIDHRIETQVVTWESLFRHCKDFRCTHKIQDSEPVVLLTDMPNHRNWFSAGASGSIPDFFIHTGMWDLYIDGDPKYPIAYELISIPLRMQMFGTYDELIKHAHKQTRGCMNDFCQDKREISFKLRSADICPECLKRLKNQPVDPLLIQQVFRVMEDIRNQLLCREQLRLTRKPSRIRIDNKTNNIVLLDLGNREIHLTPTEKTVYLFFLNHPEGVEFSCLPDYQAEICQLYGKLSKSCLLKNIEDRSRALCNNEDNCLSQVISKIRQKFVKVMGQEMAVPFMISGNSGQKRKIQMERDWIEYDP